MPPHLPEYERPPIQERALGIQFDPLPKLLTAHLAAFLESLAPEWTVNSECPAIGQVPPLELEGAWATSALQLRVATAPSLRLRAEDARRERLLQLENGWLVLNWRAIREGSSYPRYLALKSQLDELFAKWVEFVRQRGLGEVTPNLWDVSYVNFIDAAPELWSSVRDWPSVLPQLLGPARPPAVGALQTFEGQWHFSIAPGAKLQIHVQHRARSGAGEGETMVVRLVARGSVDPERRESLTDGMSRGHEAIVRTFGDIASESAREYWGEPKS